LLADHVETGLTGHRIVAHGNARNGLDVEEFVVVSQAGNSLIGMHTDRKSGLRSVFDGPGDIRTSKLR